MNNKHLRDDSQSEASRNYQINTSRYNKLVHVIPNKVFHNELIDHPEYIAKLRSCLKANLLNSCEHSILELYNNDDRAWLGDIADMGYEYAVIWPDGTWPQGEFEDNLLNVLDELNKATKRNSSWLALGKVHELKHNLLGFTEGFDYSYPIILNLDQYDKAERPHFFQLDTETIYQFMDEVVCHSRSTNFDSGDYHPKPLSVMMDEDEWGDTHDVHRADGYIKALGSLNNNTDNRGDHWIRALSSVDLHYDALFRVGNVVDFFKTVGRQTIGLDNLNAENLSETKEGSTQSEQDLNDQLNSPTAKTNTMRLMLNTIMDWHTDNPIENLNDLLKWIHKKDMLSSSDDDGMRPTQSSYTIGTIGNDDNREGLIASRMLGDTMTHNRENLYSLKLLQYQIVYITNTESVPIADYSNSNYSGSSNSNCNHEVMLLPCSGLHQFYHILANPNCKRVIWYDFNPYSVEWTKKVLNEFYVYQDEENYGGVVQQFDNFVYENRSTITKDGVIMDENIEYDFDNVITFFGTRLWDDNDPDIGKNRADIFDVDSWRSKLESDRAYGQLNDMERDLLLDGERTAADVIALSLNEDQISGERFALSGDNKLGRAYWWKTMEHIKSLEHEFIVCDAVKDWETLANAVGVDNRVFMQLTNIWQYEVNYLNSDGLDAQIAFLNLINTVLKNNKSLYFTGDTPSGIHYRNKNIAELKGLF